MNSKITLAVNEARRRFGFTNPPGNLITFFENQENYIKEHKIILFKERLDKLFGFIGYESGYTFIGVNCDRPIGSQNITLAHELGHMFLHFGQLYSDFTEVPISKNKEETEAFDFASELLYPDSCLLKDNAILRKNRLLLPQNSKDLGMFVDYLCHKYFLSYPVVLRRILYSNYKGKQYKSYLAQINAALGMKYTHLDQGFYIAKDSVYSVVSDFPYRYLSMLVGNAVHDGKIGDITGESLLYRYGLLED